MRISDWSSDVCFSDLLRAASLDHEIRDHPVEAQAVVEAAPGPVDEAGHGQGGLVGVQLDLDRATVGIEDGVQGHGMPRLGGMPGRYAGCDRKSTRLTSSY